MIVKLHHKGGILAASTEHDSPNAYIMYIIDCKFVNALKTSGFLHRLLLKIWSDLNLTLNCRQTNSTKILFTSLLHMLINHLEKESEPLACRPVDPFR